MQLGDKIKYFRKKKGFTIKQLADLTSLSGGFISNLERDLNSPSITNLQQICEVLDINVVDLIQSTDHKQAIVRKDERKEFFRSNDNNVKFELLTSGDKDLNCICITLESNGEYGDTSWGHNYDEIGIVIKGKLEIKVDNDVTILDEGDSIYINKFTPHNYKNAGDRTCVTYWFSIRK